MVINIKIIMCNTPQVQPDNYSFHDPVRIPCFSIIIILSPLTLANETQFALTQDNYVIATKNIVEGEVHTFGLTLYFIRPGPTVHT